jgi:hypothetical protein
VKGKTMRRIVLIATMLLAATLAAGPVFAQKVPMYVPTAPLVIKPKIPIVKVIPPSVALGNALRVVPGAQPLGVKIKGPLYIVKLKQGNTVKQVNVNAATGAVSP